MTSMIFDYEDRLVKMATFGDLPIFSKRPGQDKFPALVALGFERQRAESAEQAQRIRF